MKHTCESAGRAGCEPCRQLEFDLWDAINRYAIAVGGDPSKHVHGNTPRMQAVVDVDALVARVRSPELIVDVMVMRATLTDVRLFLRGVARRPELGSGASDLLDKAAMIDRVLDEKKTPCRHLQAVMTEAGLLCGACRERLGP